jgi:2-dehydro-3-deoxygluconokinase
MSAGAFDVVVLGEPLAELTGCEPLEHGAALRLSFSGDALNIAAAAVGGGARVALLTRVADDELGRALLARVSELGIDTALIQLVAGENGAYLVVPGSRDAHDFVYLRRGSAASQLCEDDLRDHVREATVVVATGVTYALSPSAADAVEAAARTAATFVYDPNFRERLTSVAAARGALERLLPHCALVVPSCPEETRALLGTDDPWQAADRCLAAGTSAVAVTAGTDGVFLLTADTRIHLPMIATTEALDENGAGDSFLGTVAARLALGDELVDAVELGTAAASLAVTGIGGAGHVASLQETRAHLRDSRVRMQASGVER